jgi:hypothetical protein
MRPLVRSVTSAFTLLAAGLPACSDEPDPTSTVDAGTVALDGPAAFTDIAVNVAYNGTPNGALVIGAFRSVPPMGPPLAFQQVATPTFPASVTLRDLESGTVFVIAVLDRAPASPTRPGMEDLQAASGPLTVAGTDLSVSLTITEP